MDNKKIIYIIDNLYTAGAQKHLLGLVKGLYGKGHSVGIVCLGKIDAPIVKDLINIPIHTFKMDCIWQLSFWLSFFRLAKLLSKEKPIIVHTYLNTSNVFGVLAAKIAHVPIVISSRRDLGLGGFRSKLIEKLEIFTAGLSDKIICVSEAIRKKVIVNEHLDATKTFVIPNGIDVNQSSVKNSFVINEGEFVVGIVGNLFWVKGHKEFIEATRLVLKQIPNTKFLVIGEGALKESLQLSVASYQIQDKVIFLGKRNDIPELLSIMDVSVNASYSEGMSNTILESMAAGVPVVATAVDGNLETVINGETGLFVPPKDPQAMAAAIINILRNRELAKQMGQNARKLVEERFSLQQMVNNYSALYSELLKNKGIGANKIGYVVSLFPCWSETFILNEIIELNKRGIEVTIFSIRKDLEEFIQENSRPFLKQTKYPHSLGIIASALYWLLREPFAFLGLFWLVLRKKYPSQRILIRNIWCILVGGYFSRFARKNKLTHLHAHFATYPALTALAMSKLSGIPFTFTAHAHDIFLDKTLLKEVAKNAKAVVAISDYNRQYIADYCGNGVASKIKVIHCGVNLSDFQPFNKDHNGLQKTIVSIGRLTEMKGYEYLIKALHRIRDGIDFECHIIGEGQLKNALQKLIEELGMETRIFLDGVLDSSKVKTMLNKADLFVQPSVWNDKDGQDGIPLVLMEAMASGVPVISSNISGIPELVKEGKTGLLTQPGNVEELSRKILTLLTDKDLQSRLTAVGKKKIEEEFDVVKNVEKLIEVFSS